MHNLPPTFWIDPESAKVIPLHKNKQQVLSIKVIGKIAD